METIPILFLGIAFGLFLMIVLTWGLFLLFYWKGRSVRSWPIRRMAMAILIAALFLAIAVAQLFETEIFQVAGAMIVFLQFGIPPLMGLLYGSASIAEANRVKRERHTMEMLMDWERDRLMKLGEYHD